MEKLKQNPIVKKLGLNRILLVCILILMFVAFRAVLGSKFPVADSIRSTLNYVYFLGFLSLGVTFVIATGGIDFSIGPVMFCCALVSGYCMTSYGVPMAFAMVLCVLIGLAFGTFNGWMVSYMSVPPFIISMASMNIAKRYRVSIYQDTVRQLGLRVLTRVNGWFRNIVSVNGFPVGLIIFLAVAVLCGIVLYNTKPGRYILCLGSNSEAGTSFRRQYEEVENARIHDLRSSGRNRRSVFCCYIYYCSAGIRRPVQQRSDCGLRNGRYVIWFGGLASIGGTVIGVFIISLLQQGIMAFGLGKGQQIDHYRYHRYHRSLR